jgi:phage terminase large subunit
MAFQLDVQIPRVFQPLLAPDARYLGAWGGRGSGKSHVFAELAIIKALAGGVRIVCIREVQKTLKESSKRLIEDKLQAHGLGPRQGFTIQYESIGCPGGGIVTFLGMQDANAESIKSLEGYSVAWVEEAQTLSNRSLSLLRPTIRAPGSQLWFSWNARRKTDAVDKLLRGPELPTGAVVVKANWRDNPFFPDVLEQERQDSLRLEPDQYGHVWEGEYANVLVGAYFARQLADVRMEGRICRLAPDPLLPVRIFIDIGGTGGKSDAFSMWAAQFVGREIRVLNYYEAAGQSIDAHLEWLGENGYRPARTVLWLPHDGATQDKVYAVSYESAFKAAGYEVKILKNQGTGAAMGRVECARRMFPAVWFDSEKTQGGIDALGWYHERRDSYRNIGLGPEHDWASHGSDSFGMLCIIAEKHFKGGSGLSGAALNYANADRALI